MFHSRNHYNTIISVGGRVALLSSGRYQIITIASRSCTITLSSTVFAAATDTPLARHSRQCTDTDKIVLAETLALGERAIADVYAAMRFTAASRQ